MALSKETETQIHKSHPFLFQVGDRVHVVSYGGEVGVVLGRYLALDRTHALSHDYMLSFEGDRQLYNELELEPCEEN